MCLKGCLSACIRASYVVNMLWNMWLSTCWEILTISCQMFSFSYFAVCRLLVNTCLSAFSLCQCTLVLLFSMPKTDCISQKFLLVIELWGTWVSGNFQWNSRGHLWWDEFLVYVSINMFNTTVCCNLKFTPLQRENLICDIVCDSLEESVMFVLVLRLSWLSFCNINICFIIFKLSIYV
jgi:hypothetical protein